MLRHPALMVVAAVGIAVAIAGCSVRVSPDPGRLLLRPIFPPARAWPVVRAGGPELPGTIDWIVAEVGTTERGDRRVTELLRRPVYEVVWGQRMGLCTVREVRRIGRGGRNEPMLIDVDIALEDGPATREFEARLGDGADAPFTISRSATAVTGYITPGAGLAALSDEDGFGPVVERLVRDRAFRFEPPLRGPMRGLIVHIESFIPNPFEASVVEDFRRRGWAVLSGSFATRLSTVGRYDAPDESALPSLGARIAADVDRVCAERAYAFEAAMAYVAERHPEVPAHPTVLVGFSAGALGVPVVAARMPGRFDAGVLICGGADMLSISQRNPLGKIGLWVTMRGRPLSSSVLGRLSAEYLAATSLDPYATAPALTGIPVLMLHAQRDREIPADTGDLLYERMGRPERWMFDGGHAWVFFLLPRVKGDIARWIERAAGENGGPG